jgi:uncharacterized protein (TIRG00374 family)
MRAARDGSRGRRLAGTLLTLAVTAAAFAWIVLRFGDHADAWSAVGAMSATALAVLAVVTLVNLVVYVTPFLAALPGLGFVAAFVSRHTAFMVSNVVPAGGAVGLGLQQAMLRSYGARGPEASAAIGVTALWNALTTLGLPALAIALPLATGVAPTRGTGPAGIGLVVIVAVLLPLAAVFRSERLARRVGDALERVVSAVLALVRRPRPVRVGRALLHFRASTVEVVRGRWGRITVANVAMQLSQFAVLAVALHAAGGDTGADISLTAMFAAFSLARLGNFVPLTPGGLGTVDAAMTALLVGFGAASGPAVAAVLVWRALTLLPQVLLGAATLLVWRRRPPTRVPAGIPRTSTLETPTSA